jgi:hypothetical protein
VIDEYKRFWHYLNNYGYPPESIVRDYRIGDLIADYATIDPESGRPLAFFEITLGRESVLPQARAVAAEKRLLEMKKAVAPLDVSLWYVTAWPEQAANTVYKIPFDRDAQGQLKFETGRPPDFSSIDFGSFREERDKTSSSSKQNILQEQRKSVDWFRKISWIGAALVFLLFLVDMANWHNFAPVEIALLVLTIALAFAPFAARFKVLGLEFERLVPPSRNESEENVSAEDSGRELETQTRDEPH